MTTDSRSDADLIGDVDDPTARSDAWRELLARHSPRMWAVVRSFDIDSATAEDLLQTAWLRFLERRHQLRDHSALSQWLCMIVRNEARRVVTRRRLVPVADGWDLLADDGAPVGDGLLTDERAVALRSAFAKLGDDCRQLLRLVMADPPLSYDEIAVLLDRPRGSLGPTRQRCLEQLRRLLPPGVQP